MLELENINRQQVSSLRSCNGGKKTNYGFLQNRKSSPIEGTKDYALELENINGSSELVH